MWFKEHKKQVIISAIAVLAVVAALVIGITIGRNNPNADPTMAAVGDSTEDPAENTDTEEPDTTEEAAGTLLYDIRVTLASSWGSDGAYGGTYNITFTNNSDADVKEWKAEIEVPEGSSVSESWGCETEIKGTTLTATAVDWGAAVAKGSQIEVGFNMNTPSKITPEIAAFYVDGTKQDGTALASNKEEPTTEEIEPQERPEPESGTPLENHGALSVKGTQLVDQNGNPYQLKGVSTHGLAWFPEYVNKEAFQTIRDDWGGNVVRLAMYTDESGGYCSGGNKDQLKALIDNGVNYATELGMYVIIDWHILHDTDPLINQGEAEKFFAEMSAKYANYDNVLYEICNEPNGGATWAGSVKPYAEDIIPIIRKNDPDAIIIVGTPTWSQDVDIVADDPITGQSNIMYAVHFYAATHTDNIRNKVTYALDHGLPVFVSEFSLCDASGNGANDLNQAQKWFDLIDSNNMSYCSWSLSNKAETSALIQSSCSKTSGWTEDELSETGKWIRNQIQGN